MPEPAPIADYVAWQPRRIGRLNYPDDYGRCPLCGAWATHPCRFGKFSQEWAEEPCPGRGRRRNA